MQKDTKYRETLQNIEDFVFDASVSQVFEDMIDRSVPGYRTLLANIGPIAAYYITPNSNCYDLGCSHGMGSLSIFKALNPDIDNVKIFAIDNAAAMIKRCQEIILQNNASIIKPHLQSIQDCKIENASFALLNLTLQFIPVTSRADVIKKIYAGLNPHGACVLTEKIMLNNTIDDELYQELHHNFKAANQYSELEISQKRKALENVLIRETLDDHKNRLFEAGFSRVNVWFQCLNFVSLLAIK